MAQANFVIRRGLPWFGAGTVFGLIGSQVLRDWVFVPPPELDQIQEKVAEVAISPHYPSETLPSSNNVVVRGAYTTSINYRTKTPDWVAEMLTLDLLNGKNGNRKSAQFKSDSDVPLRFKALNTDYWDSGWSRGHLAAAASHKHSQEGQDSTFLLNSNIVPQDMSMNGCDWNRLEVLVRDVTKTFPNGKVFVLSGPVWKAEMDTPFTQRPFSKNKVIMHEVLGETQVHVPTHMFKVVKVVDQSTNLLASVGFLMPNRPIADERPVESFKAKLEEIELHTGLDLSGMKSSTDLCTVVRCEKPTNRRMLGWRHYGHIDEAKDLEELRTATRNAIDAGFVDGDNFLIAKAVRDRMNDLGIKSGLFPDEEKYEVAVQRGIDTFTRKNTKSDSIDS